jgi:hypothetical protein
MSAHKRKPTKDTPYPKKFRMKLEKIAARKEGREPTADEALEHCANVLGRELLEPGGVHMSYASIDDDRHRLSMRHWIQPVEQVSYLSVWPPWLPETPASE